MLAAVEAGVDAVDAAMDAMSGLTSQPCLGSIVEALRHTERDTGLDPEAIRQLSFYWEAVRAQYAAFESDLRAGASEVYLHEMPGGQFTNLKEQARSLGLETRWHEVARAYRAANDLFGDIVKVTPSSKVVGDMALMMVAQGLTAGRRARPGARHRLPGLGGRDAARRSRPAARRLAGGAAEEGAQGRGADHRAARARCWPTPTSTAVRAEAEKRCGRALDENELASYLMYPKVFADFAAAARKYGPVVGAADAGLLLRHGASATRSPSAPLEDLGEQVRGLLAREVHTTQLRHRVVAVLEEHPVVELLGPAEADGGVDRGVAADVEVPHELVEEEATQALRAAGVPGEERSLDHLGQVDQGEHGTVEVREVAPEDVGLVGGEVLGDVDGHGPAWGAAGPRAYAPRHPSIADRRASGPTRSTVAANSWRRGLEDALAGPQVGHRPGQRRGAVEHGPVALGVAP